MLIRLILCRYGCQCAQAQFSHKLGLCTQARALLRLGRVTEVGERGAAFLRSFGARLAQQQATGGGHPLLRSVRL